MRDPQKKARREQKVKAVEAFAEINREIPLNYMTLPGTNQKSFEAFFQFDEDEPVKFAETRNKLTIELSGQEKAEGVGVGIFTSSSINFTTENQKNFKIFLKPKK